jgi:hypothetical protein
VICYNVLHCQKATSELILECYVNIFLTSLKYFIFVKILWLYMYNLIVYVGIT